jgi:hypothetical protein
VYDAGEISGQVHYIAGGTGDDAMMAALSGGTLMAARIQLKSATGTEDLTFDGYLTEYGPDEMEVDGKQTASFTFKISGAITQGPSA